MMREHPFSDQLSQKLHEIAQDVETSLREVLKETLHHDQSSEHLYKAMQYGVLGAGKRLRPFLLIHIAELLGTSRKQAMRPAAALELIHCYSLIHDDLPAMDDDDMRRGKPTLHKAFDEATAILTGDALLTQAFLILSTVETHPDTSIRCQLAQILAKNAFAMVEGQMKDIEIEKNATDEKNILLMMELKTARLIESACMMGAVVGGGDKIICQNFADYGRALGMAFQIRDDMLDRFGDASKMGKAVQKDQKQGKKSSFEIWDDNHIMEEAEAFMKKAIEALKRDDMVDAPLLEALVIFTMRREH